jgi:hypothetical protein
MWPKPASTDEFLDVAVVMCTIGLEMGTAEGTGGRLPEFFS